MRASAASLRSSWCQTAQLESCAAGWLVVSHLSRNIAVSIGIGNTTKCSACLQLIGYAHLLICGCLSLLIAIACRTDYGQRSSRRCELTANSYATGTGKRLCGDASAKPAGRVPCTASAAPSHIVRTCSALRCRHKVHSSCTATSIIIASLALVIVLCTAMLPADCCFENHVI